GVAARARGHRLLARAAPRPRLGHGLPRGHENGGRPRRAAPAQARPAGAHSYGPRRRLQSRPGMSRLDSLRTRLFAATFLAVVLSIGLSLAIGAVLTRREVERATLRGLANQADLLATNERKRSLLPLSRLDALQSYLSRQGERAETAKLDGSSPYFPADKAGLVRKGRRVQGTITIDGVRYF